jgi:hypothetical protein
LDAQSEAVLESAVAPFKRQKPPRLPHLFEFMDQSWPPAGLHATLREILETGNSRPFRSYYSWAAREARRLAHEHGFDTIIELGAGTAPISRHLAGDPKLNGTRIVACDNRPDRRTFEDLARRFPGRVEVRHEPVDFSKWHAWPDRSLLVLSGCFHHLPPDARLPALRNLTSSGAGVMVCEPLRKSLLSMAYVPLSIIPALLLPLLLLGRPGRLRRMLWCWLLPVAPVLFVWDGLVSCLRMWSRREWRENLDVIVESRRPRSMRRTIFCTMAVW